MFNLTPPWGDESNRDNYANQNNDNHEQTNN